MTWGPRARHGYVLLAALWIIVTAASMVLVMFHAAHSELRAAANRIALVELEWVARSCSATASAVADSALSADPDRVREVWAQLGTALPHDITRNGLCTAQLEPAGLKLDVNTLTDDSLRRLLIQLGVGGARAALLIDSFMDWRDADYAVRPSGAEQEWYNERDMAGPRNGLIRSSEEIRRIRGFNDEPGLLNMLDIARGAVLFTHAPLPVLAALPGMTPEAVRAVGDARARGTRPTPASLVEMVAGEARSALLAQYPLLMERTIITPETWVLRILVTSNGDLGMTEETALRRRGQSVAVERRRIWLW